MMETLWFISADGSLFGLQTLGGWVVSGCACRVTATWSCTKGDTPIWSTNTERLPGKMCHLRMTDEGKLELYQEAEKIWSSEWQVRKTDDEMAPQQDPAVCN